MKTLSTLPSVVVAGATALAASAAITVIADGSASNTAGVRDASPTAIAPASGIRHQDLKLRLVFDPDASHANDVAPDGPSAGDTYVYSATIKRHGRVIGRLEGVTTAADNRYQGDVSTQYFVLHHGTVAVLGGGQSGAPGVGRPDNKIFDAVVGGTGAYDGVGGWVSAHDVNDRVEAVTLHLQWP